MNDLVAILLITLGLSAGLLLRYVASVESHGGTVGVETVSLSRAAVMGYARYQPLFVPAVLAALFIAPDWFVWLGAVAASGALVLIWVRIPVRRIWARGIRPSLSGNDLDGRSRTGVRVLFWCEVVVACTTLPGGLFLLAGNS